MKICFHLAHPAHYHLFKNIIKQLQFSHTIYVTYNKKDVLKYLLENDTDYSFEFIEIKSTRKSTNTLSLFKEFIQKELGLLKVLKKIKPDLILGTSIVIAHVGKILGIKSVIVNEDDFQVVYNTVRIGYPFTNHILAPKVCNAIQFENKTIHYDGYHELTYLSPKYFNNKMDHIPADSTKPEGIKYLIRLSALSAHHDVGKTGITLDLIQSILKRLIINGNIVISSEKQLPSNLNKYSKSFSPLEIHNILSKCDLYIGDSQTMAAEAAVLGTPSLRFNDFVGKLGYLEELEHKYGLTYGIKTSEPQKLLDKIDELLAIPNLKEEWQIRRQKMLADKIDVTAFMVWFIENYPDSVRVMKENPDYQYRFK